MVDVDEVRTRLCWVRTRVLPWNECSLDVRPRSSATSIPSSHHKSVELCIGFQRIFETRLPLECFSVAHSASFTRISRHRTCRSICEVEGALISKQCCLTHILEEHVLPADCESAGLSLVSCKARDFASNRRFRTHHSGRCSSHMHSRLGKITPV